MHHILAIDTATEACSVALSTPSGIFTRFEECPQQHAQKLLGMIDAVLGEAGCAKSTLEGMAFGQGPGSFTGVRIATAHCQGLALGLDIPVVGISTLATLAQATILSGASTDGETSDLPVVCAIDARMGEVYFAQYQVVQGIVKRVDTEQVIAPALAVSRLPSASFIAAGTGWAAYPELAELATAHVRLPTAEAMLPLAQAAFANGAAQAVADIVPEYVRNTVTWQKLPGR